MRHTRTAAALAFALAPVLAQAAYGIDHITATCSDSLTLSEGDALSFQCQGNLTLTGDGDQARLFADQSLSLSATGELILSHLALVSPTISLSGGNVRIGQDVVFFSESGPSTPPPAVQISTGAITLNPHLTPISGSAVFTMPRDVTLTWNLGPATVPEPAAIGLLFAGLGTILIARRRQRRS